jgi:hypothetical protein
MALEKELSTYRHRIPELMKHEGSFVLIHGDEVVDFFGKYDQAIQAGYHRFGLASSFLVKQIHAVEKVQFVSRLIVRPAGS